MRGVIAAGDRYTAETGADVLRDGGNAVDAAIAAAAMACVTEPVLASLGGGGFMQVRRPDGTVTLYDFFCQTPRHARPTSEIDFRSIHADFGETTQEFHIGVGSAAVPGMPHGLAFIQHAECTRPLAELLQPAVELARRGVTVTPFQAFLLRVVAPIYVAEARTRTVFCRADGELVRDGDRIVSPGLADSLECLGRDGARAFADGDVASEVLRLTREQGGHLLAEDLQNYRVVRREPIRVGYRDAVLHTNPPPSCGGILIAFALRLAEELAVDAADFGSRRHIERLCRVMELTSKARVESGLAELAPSSADHLLDPAFLTKYRADVAGRPCAVRGTTHISVVDRDGVAAAVTLSNGEGCGVMLPNAGFMLNNVLGEEDLNPNGFHNWAPDTRVSSMMAPSIVTWADGRVLALGSGGSNRIRTAILQVLLNLIDHGMPLDQAIAAPRMHLENGKLDAEPGYDADAVASFAPKDGSANLWAEPSLFFGGVHAAESSGDGAMAGAGDHRRSGVTLTV